jgi:hypothetical protein
MNKKKQVVRQLVRHERSLSGDETKFSEILGQLNPIFSAIDK